MPGTVTEPRNGVTLCPKPETASTAVEETAVAATDNGNNNNAVRGE